MHAWKAQLDDVVRNVYCSGRETLKPAILCSDNVGSDATDTWGRYS